MQVTPLTADRLGSALDHPEGLAIGPDGTIWCGGEAGQVYRISGDNQTSQLATTGGFILGVALDGAGRVHLCDWGRNEVLVFDPEDASIQCRAQIATPNWGVFLPNGEFLVSSSGEFYRWQEEPGRLVSISPKGHVSEFHSGPFAFANGMAVDPWGKYLYVAESVTGRISRVALEKANSPIEVMHHLPPGIVPDGLAFTADGRLLIGCYAPDCILLVDCSGKIELLLTDVYGDLLSRPSNVALFGGYLYCANLGGWHITRTRTDLTPLALPTPLIT